MPSTAEHDFIRMIDIKLDADRPDTLHHGQEIPASPWVMRFSALIRAGGEVLDLACGSGRHARALAQAGFAVEAVDRNAEALEHLRDVPEMTVRQADLEQDAWPYAGHAFDAVVVTNYLFRPRFDLLLALLRPGGVLIYETFMIGNEQFGKPSSPDFLLAPGELLKRCEALYVAGFEQGVVQTPRAAVIQRICAVRAPAALAPLP